MQTLFWTVANTEGSLTVIHPQKHSHPEIPPPRSAETNTEQDTDKLGFFSDGGGRGGDGFLLYVKVCIVHYSAWITPG
jgi:hypothetical protein